MSQTYVITGGAGFIGSNLAVHFLSRDTTSRVIAFDNFSRFGAVQNVEWVKHMFGDRFQTVVEDVRRPSSEFTKYVERADAVVHLAAQVAVTTSVTDPRTDFEINALGTFNVLETVRASKRRPAVLYSSTNKVYGKMSDVQTEERDRAYRYSENAHGIDEARPLDFFSPYGCSKGTGDQYVMDYARIYGLKTVVFRQSCIYGPRQFGIEDQGWVAWFAICARHGVPITIYGDGKQVRDILYIDDLAAAYDLAIRNIDRTAGQVYNLGGGPENTVSLLQLLKALEEILGKPVCHSFEESRPGDQLVFVSDIRKAQRDLGWRPQVGVKEGIGKLLTWIGQEQHLFRTQAETAEVP